MEWLLILLMEWHLFCRLNNSLFCWWNYSLLCIHFIWQVELPFFSSPHFCCSPPFCSSPICISFVDEMSIHLAGGMLCRWNHYLQFVLGLERHFIFQLEWHLYCRWNGGDYLLSWLEGQNSLSFSQVNNYFRNFERIFLVKIEICLFSKKTNSFFITNSSLK